MLVFLGGGFLRGFKKLKEKEGNESFLKKERIDDGEEGEEDGEDEEGGGVGEDKKDESSVKLETEEARRLIFSFKDCSISCLGFQLSWA